MGLNRPARDGTFGTPSRLVRFGCPESPLGRAGLPHLELVSTVRGTGLTLLAPDGCAGRAVGRGSHGGAVAGEPCR
jgi:hypothetical protein